MNAPIPLLLLPGSLCDATMWSHQLHGLTGSAQTQVPDFQGLDSVPAMAEAVLAEAQTGPFAIAGFSLGGYVALEIVRRAPERVLALALLDTSARADKPENASGREANIAAFAECPAEVVEKFVAITAAAATPPEVIVTVRNMMLRRAQQQYIAQQRAMMTRPDARATLASIRCPVLCLWGSADRATPPEVNRELATSIPDARMLEIADAGHMTPLEAPAQVTGALRDWLQRTAVM